MKIGLSQCCKFRSGAIDQQALQAPATGVVVLNWFALRQSHFNGEKCSSMCSDDRFAFMSHFLRKRDLYRELKDLRRQLGNSAQPTDLAPTASSFPPSMPALTQTMAPLQGLLPENEQHVLTSPTCQPPEADLAMSRKLANVSVSGVSIEECFHK